MSDLISREELMKLWDEYHPYIATRAIQFDQALRKLPSAYPKKGKWKCTHSPNGFLLEQTCSECGLTFEEPSGVDYNYCPQCGCRMDEE